MSNKTDTYKVSQVNFVVPNNQTAQLIFESAMKLKPLYFSETTCVYQLNSRTSLTCWIENKDITGTLGKVLRLQAPKDIIIEVAQKLKGSDVIVFIDNVKRTDGSCNILLQIFTPHIYTNLVISSHE